MLVTKRLHRVHQGVYAVGRPDLTAHGRWMAAVVACGEGAVLSHDSAAGLWRIRPADNGPIHISIPSAAGRRRPGVVIHRRTGLGEAEVTTRDGIPVTSPACTLVDVATRLGASE